MEAHEKCQKWLKVLFFKTVVFFFSILRKVSKMGKSIIFNKTAVIFFFKSMKSVKNVEK